MIEIYKNLFIGNEQDYEDKIKYENDWYVIHACKEPYHRKLLGYTGRGAPKEHPEYLLARRGTRLFLNLVDAADPAYIPKELIDSALEFILEALNANMRCLVHCNLGESRSPSIGFIYLVNNGLLTQKEFSSAESEFQAIYPNYNPKAGIRNFIINNWSFYVK